MARLAARTGALLGILTGALVTALLPASPAHAADVEFRVRGLPSVMQVEGDAGPFEVRTINSEDRAYESVRLVITVRLSDLGTGDVQVSRDGQNLTAVGGRGTVRFGDPDGFALDRRSSSARTYQLRFLAGSPTGRALVTAAGFIPDSRRALGSSRGATTLVRAGAASPSPSAPDVSADATPTDEAGAGTGDETLAGDASRTSDDGGLLWPVYLFGALLLGAGGIVGWFAFRRYQESRAAAGAPEPMFGGPASRGPGSGGPVPGGPLAENPTLVMPRVAQPGGYDAGAPSGYSPPGYVPGAPEYGVQPGYGPGPGYSPGAAPGYAPPAPQHGPGAGRGYPPGPGQPRHGAGGNPPSYGSGAPEPEPTRPDHPWFGQGQTRDDRPRHQAP